MTHAVQARPNVLASWHVDMDEASPPDSAGGSSHSLLALRHALADPLSSIALKLDLIERRLQTPAGADPSWLMERARAAQGDVVTANRLLALLVRLAEIAAEPPRMTTVDAVCRAAAVALPSPATALPRLTIRPRAAAEAIQNVASFAAAGNGETARTARASFEDGRVVLAIEGPRVTADGRPERLLDLPHGVPDAEPLFVARAAVEADGGRLELTESSGSLVALFSWPAAASNRSGVP